MKCLYHVSFIQQQTLLASITRANNMLLIWFQETVSRQLNFQLLSYGECMHKPYLYLSSMKAGSDAHIPVSCHSRIKRNVNRSSSLMWPHTPYTAKNSYWFHWEFWPASETCVKALRCSRQLPPRSWTKESWAGNQRCCCGSSPFLPHGHLLLSSNLAFHTVANESQASAHVLQLYSTQNQ